MADEHSGTGVVPQLTNSGDTKSEAKPPGVAGRGSKPWWYWFRNVDHILALVAILAGGMAVWLELKVHHDVSNISENASTVYLPEWPEHTGDLTALVSHFQSGDELAISSDVGYTHFTHPDQFKEYFQALRRAANLSSPERPLKMLVPDHDTNLVALNKQFIKDKDDPADKRDFNWLWKNEPGIFTTYCAKYPEYQIDRTLFCRAVSRHQAVVDPRIFFDVVMYVEDSLSSELLVTGKVKIRTIHDESLKKRSPYLWIRHRQSWAGDRVMEGMIFAYSRFFGPAKGKGYGWRTYDGHLIEIHWREFMDEFDNAGESAELRRDDHLYQDAVNKIKPQLTQ